MATLQIQLNSKELGEVGKLSPSQYLETIRKRAGDKLVQMYYEGLSGPMESPLVIVRLPDDIKVSEK